MVSVLTKAISIELPVPVLDFFESNAEKNKAPYLMPQETGNHMGTRNLRVYSEQGSGILLKAIDKTV